MKKVLLFLILVFPIFADDFSESFNRSFQTGLNANVQKQLQSQEFFAFETQDGIFLISSRTGATWFLKFKPKDRSEDGWHLIPFRGPENGEFFPTQESALKSGFLKKDSDSKKAPMHEAGK